MDIIYVDILTRKNIVCVLAIIDLIYWLVCSSSWRGGWYVVKRVQLFQSVARITLLKYMLIWCNIQVILYRLLNIKDTLSYFRKQTTDIIISRFIHIKGMDSLSEGKSFVLNYVKKHRKRIRKAHGRFQAIFSLDLSFIGIPVNS